MTARKKKDVVRCTWASNELSILYHDREWGVPQHDDRVLFEFLILEGAQAGLSWDTILRKRENYRAAFDGFDPNIVARYDRRKAQRLLRDGRAVVGLDNLNNYYDPSLKEARLKILERDERFRLARLDLTDRAAIKSLFALVRHRSGIRYPPRGRQSARLVACVRR